MQQLITAVDPPTAQKPSDARTVVVQKPYKGCQQLLDSFRASQALYDLYIKVTGFLVLVFLAEAGIVGLACIYRTVVYTNVAGRIGGWDAAMVALQCYAFVVLLAHLGQTMEDKMGKDRIALNAALLRRKLGSAGQVQPDAGDEDEIGRAHV